MLLIVSIDGKLSNNSTSHHPVSVIYDTDLSARDGPLRWALWDLIRERSMDGFMYVENVS